MAKFNIEVELDWVYDEEGCESIDHALRDEITRKIVEQSVARMSDSMEEEIKQVLEEKMAEFKANIDKKLESIMDEFFDKPRDITDNWGRTIRKGVTARQLLSDAADKFFTEKVDENGNANTYNAKYTRIEYIAKKAVNHDITWAVEKAVKDAVDGVKKKVKDTATRQLGEKMAEVVGLDNLMNGGT